MRRRNRFVRYTIFASLAFAANVAPAFYDPTVGKWISRDPPGEIGGKNLLAFVENDPVATVDAFGLEGVNQPPGLPYDPCWGHCPKPLPVPNRPPGYIRESRVDISCCTDEEVDAGMKELDDKFDIAVTTASLEGLVPVSPPNSGATCKNSSFDFIAWLMPFPPCWECFLEERDAYPNDLKDEWMDHRVIVCRAYRANTTMKIEKMYDWWGGSIGSPENFRRDYPYTPPNVGGVKGPGISTYPYCLKCDGTPFQPLPDWIVRPGFPSCKE